MADVTAFAEFLIEARRCGRRVEPPKPWPATHDAALAVQRLVAATLGPIGGFKVARQAGTAPILAPIPAGEIVDSGAQIPVADRLGVELEVGFEVVSALPADRFPAVPQDFFRPRPVLELVDTRLAGAAAEDPILKLADMQINRGLVLGPRLDTWDGSDFGTLAASLHAGDSAILDGRTEVPGGSALANLELLCSAVGDHCGGVQPGQVIITGSICGLPWFPTGTDLRGRIDGLGDVAVSLV